MTSLKDIADRTGFSVATVSRVLNDDSRISDATKEKVRAVAKELNYSPNYQAKVLAGRKARIVGFMASEPKYAYDLQVLRGLEDAAKQEDYRVLSCFYYDDVLRTEAYHQLLEQSLFDGVIVGFSGWQWRREVLGGKPVVYVDQWPDETDGGSVVTSDHALSASLLIEYFVDQRVEAVVYYGTGTTDPVERSRYGELEKRAAGHGLDWIHVAPPLERLVEIAQQGNRRYAVVFEPRLGPPGPLDGSLATFLSRCVCGFFDGMPRNLSNAFDDPAGAASSSAVGSEGAVPCRNLAIVRQDHAEMGRQAFRTLLDAIVEGDAQAFTFVPVRLSVWRDGREVTS